MKIPIGHFDTSEQSPEEIADALTDRIDRLMQPGSEGEGEAVPAPDEVKHADHDQSSHGSWARDVLDSLSDAAVRVEQADFDGFDVEKAVGIPVEEDRDVIRRATEKQKELTGPIWTQQGERNPEHEANIKENFTGVPFGLLPEFREKVKGVQRDVSRQGTEEYVRKLDEAEDFDPPLLAWDPETDTYIVDDGYHRMVAMLAGGMNLFDVLVPRESPWAKAMEE